MKKRFFLLFITFALLAGRMSADVQAEEITDTFLSEEEIEEQALEEIPEIFPEEFDIPEEVEILTFADLSEELIEQVERETEKTVKVMFFCDPVEIEVTVYFTETGGRIDPEEDGSWLLTAGEYLYEPFLNGQSLGSSQFPVLDSAEQMEIYISYMGDPAVYQATSGKIIPLEVEGTYHQTEARSMLSAVNAFRTGDEAWYWNHDNTTKTTFSPGRLRELIWDYSLEKTAMLRAAELAVNYSHTRPDETAWFSAYYFYYSSAGENIAYGYGTVPSVFNAWKEDCILR